MALNNEDKILIKTCTCLRTIVPEGWLKIFSETLNYFLKKLRESGSTGRQPGSDMQQTITDDAIDEWRARLRACVRAKGGHFEHLL